MSVSRFDFGRIAGHYDRWYRSRRGSLYDRLEKGALDRLLPDPSRGSSLLDVGCGTGHWSQYFADRGFDVTGIDLSEQMIQIAGAKDLAGNCFLVADAENLPFADSQFDVAAAITMLEFAAHPNKVLAEMARCVRTRGGTLIVGALNALSPCNQQRKKRHSSVYASATLFSPRQLEDLLSQLGNVRILTAGFVPTTDWLLPLSPLVECSSRSIWKKRGAFIAARVAL